MTYDPGSTQPSWQGSAPPPQGGSQPPLEEPGRDWLPIVLAAIALLLAIGGIIVGVIALSQQDETAQESSLGQGVVTAGQIDEEAVEESTIADGAVSENKLADGAVTEPKIADHAVIQSKIAPETITGGKVKNDSLTGQQIDESTLDTVPSAEVAETAKVAESLADGQDGDAEAPSLEFHIQQASSDDTSTDSKAVDVSCPEGAAPIGGGAAVVGGRVYDHAFETRPPAALMVSIRTDSGWRAEAQEYADFEENLDFEENWRLDVVVVCAIFEAGGSGS